MSKLFRTPVSASPAHREKHDYEAEGGAGLGVVLFVLSILFFDRKRQFDVFTAPD